MSKKVVEPIKRVKIYSSYFTGYLDEMPEEAKEKMKAEKPEAYKMLFEKQEQQ